MCSLSIQSNLTIYSSVSLPAQTQGSAALGSSWIWAGSPENADKRNAYTWIRLLSPILHHLVVNHHTPKQVICLLLKNKTNHTLEISLLKKTLKQTKPQHTDVVQMYFFRSNRYKIKDSIFKWVTFCRYSFIAPPCSTLIASLSVQHPVRDTF